MNVIFDTETTGIPPKGAQWELHYHAFPFIVQLSWKRSDQDHVNDYIINNGVQIPAEAIAVHGITQEMADKSEHDFLTIAEIFISDCMEAEELIAHNGYFDISIFKANIHRFTKNTYYRNKVNQALHKDKRVDTMMKTINFCNIPFSNGRGKKWPKLEELYFKLFNETFNAHNAKDDVLATERCYLELVKQGII